MSANSNVGFARLFFGDAAIVLLLLNNVRHRMVARVFGVSREDSNLVTVVAIGSAAVAVHATATRVRRRSGVTHLSRTPRSEPPSLRGTALGIAGEPSRAVPAFGGLMALALLGRSSRPALRGALRTTRGSVRGVATAPYRLRAFAQGRYAGP